jgi:hypothetical protein
MAYANSILFYGWKDEQAKELVSKLISPDSIKLMTRKDANKLQKMLADKKLPFKFDCFMGALGSNVDQP